MIAPQSFSGLAQAYEIVQRGAIRNLIRLDSSSLDTISGREYS